MGARSHHILQNDECAGTIIMFDNNCSIVDR